MRYLLGFVGVIAIASGVVVAGTVIGGRALGWSRLFAAVAVIVALGAVAGGVELMRGAIRGRIAVRRHGG